MAGHHKYLADEYLFDDGTLPPIPDLGAGRLVGRQGRVRAGAGDVPAARDGDFPIKDLDRGQLERQLVHDPATGDNPPFELAA